MENWPQLADVVRRRESAKLFLLARCLATPGVRDADAGSAVLRRKIKDSAQFPLHKKFA
jgi:hypothetical protein